MFRNHLKTAFSNIRRNKLFSSINILGLALGITASLLIMMYIVNELSYENFQKNRKNIYRIDVVWGNEGNRMKFAGCMPALGPALVAQVPEVLSAVRIKKDYDAVVKNMHNQEMKEGNFFFSDPSVFDVFTINLREGNKTSALTDPYTVVISRKMVAKYFPSSDPLGQTLSYHNNPLKITGIIDDLPENTHFRCDFLVSWTTLVSMGDYPEQPWNSWGDALTYLLLKDNVTSSSLVPKLEQLLSKNAGQWMSTQMKFDLQPLNNIHWITDTRSDIGQKGNKTYVYIFICAAIFVLLIACFNFLNLSVSQYLGRMKEVGIRKTAGARKGQVVFQFLTESMVIIFISTLIAVFLFDGLYLKFYSYLGASFVIASSYFPVLTILTLIIVFVVGAVAGGYPAFYISGINPVDVLRKEPNRGRKKISVRKLLIMLQFTISIILLSGTLIIFRQINYMKNSPLGFQKGNVILVTFPGNSPETNGKYDVIREELLKNPNIRSLSGAFTLPGINSQMSIGVKTDGSPAESSVNIQAVPADYGFVKTMGLEIIKGRDLSKDYSIDRYESALLNETAAKALGLQNPVGTKLIIPGDDYKNGVKVVGIVRDFHLQSFHNKINPMIIFINPKMYICIAVKLNPGNTNETIDYIKTTWNKIMPETNFQYKYLDEIYDSLYVSEEKSGMLLSVFTIIALFISCLGLFGFASFIVRKRIKEVGIRKVMGAGIISLSASLSRQFIVWIAASSIIAVPVGYILLKKWLENFVFRMNIEWWVFAVAILMELIIALAIVGWLSLRTAARNPVEALRYE
jgi:putative ABC transport system permease protein